MADACEVVQSHKSLLHNLGILVVDATLLVAMLIGLLRHPYRNLVGMWNFLYQQVMFFRFLLLALSAESLLVYNLDSVGHVFGDTACGQSHFRRNDMQLTLPES
jgi:hypothetical protein